MKKKECPSCAMIIEESADVCPVCQYEFPSSFGLVKWGAIGLVILFIVYLFYNVFL